MGKKWEDRSYLLMVNVKAENDKLHVQFANGDVAQIKFSAITAQTGDEVAWAEAHVSDDRLHLIVPAAPSAINIAWHLIRSLTDTDFARHMAECASNQARHIGSRLRELRKQRGLTQAQVAAVTGIEPGNLSRIESGHFDVASSTLWKVLAAMGYSPGDLAPI